MLDTTKRHCELEDFDAFISKARPLETFEYYFGFSLTDTVLSNQLRKMAYSYAVHGKIYLVQKRINHNFIFIAIKASVPPIIRLLPMSDEKFAERERRYRKGL
jgi:hypothetical protein